MKQQKIAIASCLLILFAVLVTINPRAVEAATAYADGEYTVPLEILKETTDEASATSEYMVSPAKLVIQNGIAHATVTLNNGSWWQYFKTETAQAGSFTEVKLLSEDSEKGTKIVQFEVIDIEQPLNAKLHIIVTGIPGFVYDNKYDIRLKFDYSAIPIAKNVSIAEPEATAPDAKPEDKPEDKLDAVSKPTPQLQPEQAAKPKPTPEENIPIPAPEAILETEKETETEAAIEIEAANTEQIEAGLADEASDGAADNISDALSEPAEDQLVSDAASETVEDSNNSSTSKVVLYSLLALGLIVLLLIIIRARKHKK